MKKNNELNELIYEYYQSRILFGVYKYGEQLKSIPQICASFRVARNTVQIALNRLEENRYKNRKREGCQGYLSGDGRTVQGKCYKVFCSAQGWNTGYSVLR